MSESAAAFSLPEDWRDLAREVSSQEAVPTEALLHELGEARAGGEFDFSEGWQQLVAALADALERLAPTPPLAAAFLRAEWEEIARIAETVEGEAPPEEVADKFRHAAQGLASPFRVRQVAGALRAAAWQIGERGDLSPLQDFEWPAEPDAAEAGEHTPARELPPADMPPAAPAPTEPALGSTLRLEPIPSELAPPEFQPPDFAETLPSEPETAPAEPFALLLLAEPALGRRFLERQLTFAGFAVETADNFREAVQRLSHGRYHAVLVEPDLVFADLASWAEHAGATRVLRLWPGGALGGVVPDREVFATPPSEEEIERLRRSL